MRSDCVVVAVEDINTFLDSNTVAKTTAGLPRPGIVVQHHEDWLALAVESVVGQQQIFVRPMLGHLAPISYYGGSTILSDGEPTIILNLPAMVQKYFTSH